MNEQTETTEQLRPGKQNDPLPAALSPAEPFSSTPITPQVGCPTCGGQGGAGGPNPNAAAAISYVYAIGRIEPRFPTPWVEKEFAQVTGSVNTKDLTDPLVLYTVLSKPENLYIARQLCWVLSIQGLDTYLLVPGYGADISLLVESIGGDQSRNDTDVVIGMRGPIARPDICNGLMLPIIVFDKIYSFDHNQLISQIPSDKTDEKKFRRAAEHVFKLIMQLTDNAGATDEHRALNYLAMRYPGIYTRVAEAFSADYSLSKVEARPSFSGQGRSVDVIFTYTHRENLRIDKSFVSVDVTGEYPYLLRAMSPYYDREIGSAR